MWKAGKAISKFIEKRYFALLVSLIFLLGVLALIISLNFEFSIDEFEHIHSTWYIQNNFRPYTDFFQHHHPLLWYVLLPFLNILGHSVHILFVFRVIMLMFAFGSGFLIYRISLKLFQCKETGLISVMMLFSTVMYVVCCFTIRPDVPQIFFGLLSLYYFISFLKTLSAKHVCLSGLFASISFLFLQKTIFLLMAYGIILCFKLIRKNIQFKPVLYFSASFLAPVLVYLGILGLNGSLGDYFLANWFVNLNYAEEDRFFFFLTLKEYILKDIFFWLFSIFGLWYVIRHGKSRVNIRETAFICILIFCSLFVIKRPWKHNYLFVFCMLSLFAGFSLRYFIEKFRMKAVLRVISFLIILTLPVYFLLLRTSNTNKKDVERAEYVLLNSSETDSVYDGKNLFNLFRPDLHYFWFSLKKNHGLDTYNKLTGGKYSDYDICHLIKEKKPKFISNFLLDLDACGLTNTYRLTKYDGLYVRREHK